MRAAILRLSAALTFIAAPLHAELQPAASPTEEVQGGAPSAEHRNLRALALGRQGLLAFERSDWEGAAAAFAEAERTAHSPVFVLFMARSRRNQARLLEARALYETARSERVEASTPSQWLAAIRDAIVELEELSSRIPRLSLRLVEAEPANVAVSVDGRAVTILGESLVLELDPGSHRIRATRTDGEIAALDLVLQERDRRVETLVFPASRTSAAVVPEGQRATRDDGPMRAPNYPAYVAGAIGLAGLVVGSVSGVLAMRTLNELDCENDSCLTSDREKGDRLDRYEALATIGFVVGGAGVATATVLFLTSPKPSAPASKAAAGRFFGLAARGTF